MSPLQPLLQRIARIVAVTLMLTGLAVPAAHAGIDLADYPLFSTVKVPGNLALALSVEYPTATTPAYLSTTSYAASSTFIGYFNPDMCYRYVYNSTTPASSYFLPVSAASSHVCSGYWSGNYLNWASMQTLDEFRWIMTGGYRSTDTNTATGTSSVNLDTILTKTWASSSQSTASLVPNKTVSSSVSGATPFGWTSITSRIYGLGVRMWFTGTGTTISSASSATAYSGQTDASKIYEVYINVAVCVNAALKEDNCTLYGSAYKPEGLMQKYALQLRYAAFGYLNHAGDTSQQRDGGVLRARMNYIGPTKPVPGSSDVNNTNAPEWSSSTGIMYTNPASADATDTATTFGVTVSNSGVMNYLNKFGYYAGYYKSKDPASELYYAAVRYLSGLSNVDSYTSGTTTAYADGFPVITKWRKTDSSTMGADPIIYSCQKNFILGIGDVNTHRDANLYGSTLRSSSSLEPTLPGEVSADSSIDAAKATNMVGTLEGYSSLANVFQSSSNSTCSSTGSQCNTYYIAGLAYHVHTNDIRSTLTESSLSSDTNMSGTQTINTYWVDVLEGQKYWHKNQYWLAAKYGGFTVPSGFTPYSGSNSTTTLSDSTWYTNSDTSAGYTTTTGLTFSTDSTYDKRPDNYYFGNVPSTMKSGLTGAFAKIASELSSANSTTYAMVRPNVNSGDAAYSAAYDPTYWTSSLIGSSVAYDSSGNATTTEKWNARDLLEALGSPATSRYIVTYCDAAATPAGMPFTAAQLTTCPTTGRLYYPSFASISNTTSTSSTPQSDYVAWLRGSRTHELNDTASSSSRIYRKRKYLLGDIVNSKVTAVGAPGASYYDVYNPGYSSFKRSYANRRTVVYAGANDGMLHAFDGSLPGYVSTTSGDTTTTSTSSCDFCGQELFAYIPSFVYGSSSTAATSGLASLGDPKRSHYYLVDGTPLSFDIDVNQVCTADSDSSSTCDKLGSTPDWRTLLIGGLGKGGKGYYAIDVTNPGTVTTTTATSSSTTTVTRTLSSTGDWDSEAAIASKILWEFPSSSDSVTIARMGYSYGAPTVVKTQKYGWVAIFTSGYNNSDGKGYFFIVNPATGTLLETVATESGSTSAPLNLAHADAYIPNTADFTADAIYGGDLRGNVWRLDLTPTTAYSAPVLMAQLSNAAGTAQPVTTRPLIEVYPATGKRYVLLGTGRLLADSDVSSTSLQGIYALYDGTSGLGNFQSDTAYSTPLSRSDLVNNSDLLSGIGSSPSSSAGWYADLSALSSSPYIAERMNVDPVAYSGVAAFGVNLPNGSVCSPSGTGRVIAIDIATGKTVLQDGSGSYIASSTSMSGVITDLTLQNVNGTVRLIVGDSKSNTLTVPTSIATSSGLKRTNWRVVPMQ